MQMTTKELRQHYPNQWLGLQNVVYQEGDAGEFISAEVIHTEDSKLSLVKWIAYRNGTDIIAIWNTADTSAIPEIPHIFRFDWGNEKSDRLPEVLGARSIDFGAQWIPPQTSVKLVDGNNL